MILRLEPSIITFSSFLTITCSENTFSQYRIWDPKDDSRAIAWFLSCPFPYGPSCVIGFASAVYANYVSFCSPDCSSWASGDIVDCALVRLALLVCVDLKAFSAFAQDTAISWDVD